MLSDECKLTNSASNGSNLRSVERQNTSNTSSTSSNDITQYKHPISQLFKLYDVINLDLTNCIYDDNGSVDINQLKELNEVLNFISNEIRKNHIASLNIKLPKDFIIDNNHDFGKHLNRVYNACAKAFSALEISIKESKIKVCDISGFSTANGPFTGRIHYDKINPAQNYRW